MWQAGLIQHAGPCGIAAPVKLQSLCHPLRSAPHRPQRCRPSALWGQSERPSSDSQAPQCCPAEAGSRQERGLHEQQQCCSSSQRSGTALPASLAMALSLSWASAAQAGVGDTITEFVESRSSLTTALATIAFILLLVLTSGVIYLSVAAWGDRTDESKDRLDEERADRKAAAAAKASSTKSPKPEYELNRSQRRIAAKEEKERAKEKAEAGSSK